MKKGFSLMELMVVIAIIGILSAVVIPSYLSSKAKSRDSVRLGDLKSLSHAVENYWQDNNYKFPAEDSNGNFDTNYSLYTDSKFQSYFANNNVPKDPFGTNYLYSFSKLDLNAKNSANPLGRKNYCLGANLETSIATTTCNLGVGSYIKNYTQGVGNYNDTYGGVY